jgi:hypothetical protein
MTGGQVSSRRVDGEYLLTSTPWATTLPGGPGSAVTLLNLVTNERRTVQPGPDEVAVCDATWCRVTVTGSGGLLGIDLMHPDGADRRRIAGPEGTPTGGDVTLLGRYVPLAIDRADGVGLSVYDLTTGQTQVVAQRAANVGGRGGVLWWSTGVGPETTWHALDLSGLA